MEQITQEAMPNPERSSKRSSKQKAKELASASSNFK